MQEIGLLTELCNAAVSLHRYKHRKSHDGPVLVINMKIKEIDVEYQLNGNDSIL